MKKMLIFLTILMFTASAFAVDNNNVASFTEWMQINGYTPSFTDDPGDIIEQWASPNGSPMEIEWDPDGDFIWHVSENAPNDCMYQIEVATPHNIIASYPAPNPYGIPDGESMNGACIANGYFYYTDYNGDITTVDDHIVQVDRNTLAAIDQWEVDPDIDQILGITYKAPYFYIVCNSTGLIYEVDLQPGGVYSIISTIPAPGGGPVSGIHYLEGNDTFWIASFLGGVVYETDSSFNILQTIPAPAGAYAIGITWPGEGENYWLTDFGNDQFYIIDGDIVVSTTVEFTIDLTDDYGDGWNGGTLDLAVNGTVVLDDITLASGYGPETFVFSVANGDFVEILYTAGSWSYENAYYVYDNLGTLVVSSGDGGATPDAYVSFTAVVAAADAILEGYVYEFGTGTPIEGAVVTIAGTGLSATTLADGSYSIVDIVPNVYDISCAAPLYITGEELAFDIVSGANTLDFSLLWSEIAVNVTELTSYLPPDETEVQTFTITNAGPGDLEYNINFDFPNEISRDRKNRAQSINIPRSNGDFKRGVNPLSTGRPPSDGIAVERSTAPTINLRDLSRGSTAWGIESSNGWFASFDVDVPEVLTNIGPEASTSSFANAGDFPLGVDTYTLSLDNEDVFGQYDVATGAFTLIGTASPGIGALGMATDPTDGTVYVCSPASLYTIDQATAATTLIGAMGNAGSMIDICVDGNGDMWGYDISDDNFYSIDKATGAGTIVGSIGYDANYGQGMTWDSITDQIFLSAFNNTTFQPELRVADRTTGNTTFIGVLGATTPGGLCQFGWISIPYSMETWVSITNNASGVVPANGGSIVVEVTFDATELIIGDVLTADLLIHNNANYTATRGDDYVIPVTLNVGATTLEVPSNVSVDPFLGLLTWEEPVTPVTEFRYDDGVITSQLGMGSNPSTVMGASHPNNAIIEEVTWLLTSEAAHPEAVIYIFGLDGTGMPDTAQLLHESAAQPNIDDTWNTYILPTPVVAPDGFFIGVCTPGIFTALGTDDGVDEPWVFQLGTQWGIADWTAGNDWLDIGPAGFPYNFSIRAYGSDLGEVTLTARNSSKVNYTNSGLVGSKLSVPLDLNYYRETRDLIGYNIYLNNMGTVLATVGADVFEYQYVDLINGDNYIAGVSAVYDEGESEIVQYPFTYTGVGADNIVNITTALKGNYPNPFNPVTNIAFSLSEPCHVTLEVYNIKGEKVRILVDKVLAADNHVISWDGTNNSNKPVASGIYFYKMISEGNSGEYTSTKKMILLK